MKQSKWHGKARWMIASGLGVVVLTAGLAWGAIPGADGVINACYKNFKGDLRVIDSSTGSCSGSETPIFWNQTGPQGPAGNDGADGMDGADGLDGTDGADGSDGWMEQTEPTERRDLRGHKDRPAFRAM